MKTSIKILIGIIILALIVIVFSFSRYNGNAVNEQNKIKIGVMIPLTGTGAQFGEWDMQGIKIAQDEENFDTVIQDDQCLGSGGINAYNQLKIENIKYMVGSPCNAASIPAAKLAENDKTIMITFGVSTEALRKSGEYIFTLLPSIDSQSVKLSEFLEKNNYTSISILYLNNEYGVENKETLIKDYKGEVKTIEAFDNNDKDFRSALSKMKNDGSQGIVIIGYATHYVNIINQITELKIDKQLFSGLTVQDPTVISATKNLPISIIYTYPQSSESRELDNFIQKYNKKYNTDVESLPIHVGAGYDSVKILISKIRECNNEKNESTDCVKNKLLEVKDYKGVNGLISFDSDGNVVMPTEIREIKNGEFFKYSGGLE